MPHRNRIVTTFGAGLGEGNFATSCADRNAVSAFSFGRTLGLDTSLTMSLVPGVQLPTPLATISPVAGAANLRRAFASFFVTTIWTVTRAAPVQVMGTLMPLASAADRKIACFFVPTDAVTAAGGDSTGAQPSSRPWPLTAGQRSATPNTPSPSGSVSGPGKQPLASVPLTAGHPSVVSATPSPSVSGPGNVVNVADPETDKYVAWGPGPRASRRSG